ncbi:MAG: hypothetical protein Q8M71_03670 [Thermodesulfovibrionales bacterium]|nr:hypothetical protein [Thermodesulfovibrionales bacterium]
MGRAGAFKSDKRRKELSRLKKQEEKRQRRFKKDEEIKGNAETESPQETGPAGETESSESLDVNAPS